MVKKTLFLILFLASALSLFPQTFGTGAIHDPELYNSVPQKAATRDITELPPSFSLKAYAPYPGHQGQYGTCNAWANAYAARTIAESIGLNRLDRTLTTSNTFSPVFVYRNISNDPDCRKGTPIQYALELMKEQGAPKRLRIEYTEDFKKIPLSLFASSPKYRIKDYTRLFTAAWSSVRGFYNATDGASKVKAVKKALSERKPVIICMECPDSFNNWSIKDLWMPTESPGVNYIEACHALCVVGYDDDKFGGAFEIQNSWGTDWGNGGYVWVRYTDFGNHVMEAYELIEDLLAYNNVAEFSGSVEIEMRDSERSMEVEFVNAGYYKTKSSHPSGTLFRYIMNCDKPAYLYAFAADADSLTRIFPAEGVSAVLDYRENVFAFPPDRPGEIDWMELDDVAGTDYLVVLFSKQPLDIKAIEERFMSARGNFVQRVGQAVGRNFIRPQYAKYEKNRIAYNAQSSNGNAVFGLLLAIEHR